MDHTCVFLLVALASLLSVHGGPTLDVQTELQTLRSMIENCQTENKVAFSATLLNSADSQTLGPYNVETTLVYKHVFTNVGNAYNSITGIFTAPVKGAYHFVFFALNNRPTSAEAYLKKNGEAVLMAHETQSYGAGTAGNAVTLILEVGDTVYVTLPANTQLYDNHHRHNTFSGHLLFKLY